MQPSIAERGLRFLALAIVLAPALAVLLSILAYGVDVPWIDEWFAIGSLFEERVRGTLDVFDLTAQHNEHRIVFPKLICLALGSWGGWDVRREMIATFLIAAWTAWNVHELLKTTVGGGPMRIRILTFLVNLLIFSPAQWANWLKGVQMALFLPPLCFTTAARLALAGGPFRLRIGGGMVLCTISTFSVGNGVLCWLAMLPLWVRACGSDGRCRAKVWTLWLAALALNLALYGYGYRRPAERPPVLFAFGHPLLSLEYLAAFLGAPLAPSFGAGDRPAAGVLGGAGFLLFVYASVRFLRERGQALERALPWIALGLFALLTAGMTTAARVGMDKGPPLASRYVTLSLHFGVALVPLIAILVDIAERDRTRLSIAARILAGFLGIAAISSWFPCRLSMQEERRKHLQGKACMHFAAVIDDLPGLRILHPRYPGLRDRILQLDRGGVFRQRLARSPTAQEVAGDPSAACGSFENLVRHGNLFFADGNAHLPERREPADAILLGCQRTNEDSTFFGMYLVAPPPEHGTVGGPVPWRVSFEASKLPADAQSISAWAFDALTNEAYQLEGAHPVR